MRAATAAIAIAAALAGCGGDPPVVPVTLELDGDSCGTEQPDEVLLSCAAAVGVLVRSRQDGAVLEEACVDLPGTERTLAALPPVLSGVDLSGLSEPSVQLELGVFTPRSAVQGCPQVGDGRPEMAVWAAESLELDGADRAVVRLECAGIGRNSGGCADACDDEYVTCESDGGQTACGAAYESCAASCDDDESWCFSYCENGRQECLENDGWSACELVLDGCVIRCDDEYSGDAESECEQDCYGDYQMCREVGFCELLQEDCLDDCEPDGPTCASLL